VRTSLELDSITGDKKMRKSDGSQESFGDLCQYQYEDYEGYIEYQRDRAGRTVENTHRRTNDFRHAARYLSLIYPRLNSLICLGCRDVGEVNAFRAKGFKAVGIDLLPAQGVICADMSRVRGDERFRDIDIAFASHSLEHCYDVNGLRESLRWLGIKVLLAESPVRAEPSQWDCTCYEFMKEDCKPQDIEKVFPDFVVSRVRVSDVVWFVAERKSFHAQRGRMEQLLCRWRLLKSDFQKGMRLGKHRIATKLRGILGSCLKHAGK
jgi:hypothetical protein